VDVSITRCGAEDIDDVIRFIDEQWKPGHVLGAWRPLLDWQHRDPDGRGYSFVVARRRRDAAVLGIIGYIPTRRFDPALADHNVIWLTTWKVRDDSGVAGLGIQLLQHLTRTEPHVAVGALGLTPSTLPIYSALGYRVGELEHYVHPNAAVDMFELAALRSGPATIARDGARLEVLRLTRDSEFGAIVWASGEAGVPRKTPEYFRRRYAHHPVYSYIVVAVVEDGAAVGLLAARVAEHDGRRALRIVDFIGSPEVLARTGPPVQALLEEAGAEYADVYNVGIDADVFARAGFARVDPEGPDIVPDHFEPFERQNVRLRFSFKGSQPVIFKGDADQDRPNRVRQSPV
jgi:hypothetical protein